MKLLASEAAARGKLIKDVKYDLKLILPKDRDYFRGKFEAKFSLDPSASDPAETFFLDFQGRSITNVVINGKEASETDIEFKDHKIRVTNVDML